jgi:predicted dehydrogenase
MLQELPGVCGWTSLTQAIDESSAEAWVVACTTASHVPVAKLLLERGKTVLLEKPVADNLIGDMNPISRLRVTRLRDIHECSL